MDTDHGTDMDITIRGDIEGIDGVVIIQDTIMDIGMVIMMVFMTVITDMVMGTDMDMVDIMAIITEDMEDIMAGIMEIIMDMVVIIMVIEVITIQVRKNIMVPDMVFPLYLQQKQNLKSVLETGIIRFHRDWQDLMIMEKA